MKELYQSALKQHYQTPVGQNKSIIATHAYEGYNASCGDEITFKLRLDHSLKQLENISFDADSCAICTASASILCKLFTKSTVDDLESHFQFLTQHFSGQAQQKSYPINYAELECLLPVRKHISRINCALLPWQTAIKALNAPVNKLPSTAI